MAAVFAPRQAYIPDNAHEPPARHERAVHVPPNLVELIEELLVVSDVPELPKTLIPRVRLIGGGG